MKVMIHAGEVRSRFDGDIHFITAGQLIRLYRVDSRKDNIRIADPRIDPNRLEHVYKEYIHLYPLYSGEYYDIHVRLSTHSLEK